METIIEIPGFRFIKAKDITKGLSGDRKYYLETEKGERFFCEGHRIREVWAEKSCIRDAAGNKQNRDTHAYAHSIWILREWKRYLYTADMGGWKGC